jgi:hypothetical protein
MAVRTLPTEAEAKEIEDALQRAFDLLEDVGWAVKSVDKGDHADYPHKVTFESMGILADIRANLDNRMVDFREISREIDETMFDFGAIRETQRRRQNGGDDA